MNFLSYVKKNMTSLPYPIGRIASLVPYSLRPGLSKLYRARTQQSDYLNNQNIELKKKFVYESVKRIAVFSEKNIPFYSELYKSNGVKPKMLNCFDDISELPIITKEDLQAVSLEYRSFYKKGMVKANTGGSSGKPLEFYIEPNSIPHEWAHMHKIWAKLNFKQNNLRLVFAGRSNVIDTIDYDSARHQLNVDIYSGWEVVAEKLLLIYSYYSPSYLHGYPSSIFDFVLWLSTNNHPLLNVLKANIKGLLLGSELPNPNLRKEVESILDCGSVSWYGHTERAVLAYEMVEQGRYFPFLSYGFTESANTSENQFSLVATSYYNQVSPLIRYNTSDLIIPLQSEGLLSSFTISEGRSGEYILDKLNNKIFLTALIFGRHHLLFNYCSSIQVYQSLPGKVTIFYVLRQPERDSIQPQYLFDRSNVDLDFDFKSLPYAYKTSSGKVPLLVRSIV